MAKWCSLTVPYLSMISAMVSLINLDVKLESELVALNAKQSSISGVGFRPEIQTRYIKKYSHVVNVCAELTFLQARSYRKLIYAPGGLLSLLSFKHVLIGNLFTHQEAY